MVSRAAARLAADPPAIATAHFLAEADPYHPSANPDGYINLGTADNKLIWDLLEPVMTAPRSIHPSDIHYGQLYGIESLRQAIAALLARTWRAPVDPANLVVVSGATAALDIAATMLCDPGEIIIVPAPYYSALDVDLVGRSGARLVPVSMAGAGGCALECSALDRALEGLRRDGAVVRALAVSSPSNPQGQVHSAATLRELLHLATTHNVDIIADEIYAHCVFGAERFVSMLDPDVLGGVPQADPSRVHVVWGFAKDFGLSGLKVGVLHTTGAATRAASRALAYFAPTSTHTQALLRDLLTDTTWVRRFLAESRQRLAASYRGAIADLAGLGIDYVPAQAGFTIWIDLRSWLPQSTFAAERVLWERVVHTAKVNILPGAMFGSSEPGWFRLCHTVDPALVHHGMARLATMTGHTRRSA